MSKIFVLVALLVIASILAFLDLGMHFKIKIFKNKLRLNWKRKKKIRFNKDNMLSKYIERHISKHDALKGWRDKYANKLTLINHMDKNNNKIAINVFLGVTFVASCLFSVYSINLFSLWFVPVLTFCLTMIISIYIGIACINHKINKVYTQFPMAIQLFTDEYVSTKNIKNSVSNCYEKMPVEISRVFEWLARKFVSGSNYIEVINDFANGLDFIWGYAFAELLMLSYDGAGDISEDLIYLNELANEEIKASMEADAILVGTRMIFIVLNAVTVLGILLAINILPDAEYIYLYTPIGNMSIVFWLCSFVFGLIILRFLKYL